MTGTKLLVVDDEHILRIGTSWTLREFGFEVDEAADGYIALEMVKQNEYSVVLLDLNMPNMGGFECATKIRDWEKQARPNGPRNVIVALSSLDTPDIKMHCLHAGMNDFINKSCTKEQLKKTVSKYSGGALPGTRTFSDSPKL